MKFSKLIRGATLTVVLLTVVESCSIVFPIIAPFDDLPEPTGPYAVATRTTTWADSARDETFTSEPDPRRIVVQVWYPLAEEGHGPQALYIDDPVLRINALAEQLRLPMSLIGHFDKVSTNSYLNNPGTDTTVHFPVILFSHGLSGMRFQNTSLMEELASQGYVVFAADHSYAANVTIFSNGDIAEYRAGKRGVLTAERIENIDFTQLAIIVKDLSFMIDKISSNSTEAFLSDLTYDKNQIGVIGHSLGGAAIVNTMTEDERVDAAMVLDGWYIPVPDSVIANGLDKPLFHLGQKTWSDPNNYQRMDDLMAHSKGPIFKLLIPGTRHTDYTDMPLFTSFSYYIGYTGLYDPEWLNGLIRKSTVSFFNAYLKEAGTGDLIKQLKAEKTTSSYIFVPPAHD